MSINKRQVYLLFALCLSLFSFKFSNAQEAQNDGFLYRPQLAVKLSPLSLLAPTPSVDLAIEIATFENQALQIESGYIFKPKYYETSNYDGFKIATQYRYYFGTNKQSGRNRYLGAQHLYKQIETRGTTTVWRFNKTYQEIMPYRVNNQSHTFFLLGGSVIELGKSFFVETEVGLGMKKLKVSIKDIPEDAELENIANQSIFNPVRGEGTYKLLGFYWSIRFIYEIL